MNITQHHRRAFARGAAATGLLAALAVPALAGTAYADDSGAQAHSAPSAVPSHAAEPSAAPSAPAKKPAPSKSPTSPPSAEPSVKPSRGTEGSEPSARPSTKAPTDARPGVVPSPAPAGRDELAHTGSSATNTVLGTGAGVLIAAGAGTIYAVRRRQNH
ncbi:LPXTG cell wall anchor domain-containing protein [Streptomyces sp. BR1]|uniref:LPXTG cell wall anchor domain-containing protein n=1 Tax=Streptomyces sp. BR1 TaxID=1592323 RepID=UPI00402BA97C